MSCFFFHNWKWECLGEAYYTNLMGGTSLYAEMKGTCRDCGAINVKRTRL